MSSDPHRSDRVGPRAARGVSIGFLVGPPVGAAFGAVVGGIVFGAGSTGMWGSIVAGLVLGVLGGALWGALLSLGPPAPEDDPLPRRNDGEWTVEDERAPASGRTTRRSVRRR
jgi:hypothetical protein